MTALASTAPNPNKLHHGGNVYALKAYMLTRRAAEASNSLVFFTQGLKILADFASNTRRCSISCMRTGKENQLMSVPLFV